MANNKSFTLHLIKPSDPGLEPLKAVLPGDDTRGLVIGEDREIRALHDLLSAYLATGSNDGEISDFHEQLGARWLTSGEAAGLSARHGEDVPGRTIRWAAANGFIPGAEKSGRDWRFPQRTFLHWLSNRPKPGRKQKK
jgi:hypothetical protein